MSSSTFLSLANLMLKPRTQAWLIVWNSRLKKSYVRGCLRDEIKRGTIIRKNGCARCRSKKRQGFTLKLKWANDEMEQEKNKGRSHLPTQGRIRAPSFASSLVPWCWLFQSYFLSILPLGPPTAVMLKNPRWIKAAFYDEFLPKTGAGTRSLPATFSRLQASV